MQERVELDSPSKPLVQLNNANCTIEYDIAQSAKGSITNFHIIFHSDNDPLNVWTRAIVSASTYKREIEYLQPDTYIFKVAAEYGEYGLSEFSEESEPITMTEKVQQLKQPGKPQLCKVQPNAITLRWEVSSDDSIQKYIVYYMSKESDAATYYWNIVETKNANGMMKISNLLNNIPYTFKVVAVSKCGTCISEESEESDAITIKDHIPSKPGKPTVLASSRDSITITWDVPQHNAHLVTQYVVKCFKCEHDANYDDSPLELKMTIISTSYNVTIGDLTSCKYYKFQVSAQSSYATSSFSLHSDLIQTIDLCSPPGLPAPVFISKNAVKLTWDKPKINTHLLEFYLLIISQDMEHVHVDQVLTKLPEYELNSFFLDQHYNYFVTACDSEGKSIAVAPSGVCNTLHCNQIIDEAEDELCTISSDSSHQPKLIDISRRKNTIELEWCDLMVADKSVVQNYCIYQLCCSGTATEYTKIKEVSSDVTELKVIDLQPTDCYQFKVEAIYENATSQMSGASNKIKPCRFISSPGRPVATNVTDSTIGLAWAPPEINFDIIKLYEVRYRNGKHDIIEKTKNPDHEIVINQLTPGESYTFKVVAIGELGFDSETSEESDPIFTKPGAPSRPIQHNVSYDTVTLHWQPPVPTGNITQYCVYYNSVSDLGQLQVYTSEPQVSITYLQPNTSYTFSVASVCGSIHSDKSEISEPIKTESDKCSKPGKPKADSKSHNEITLSWTKPEQNCEIVKSYVVFSFENYKKISKSEETTDATITIKALKPNTRYQFQVKAICKSGKDIYGDMSALIVTEQEVSSDPGEPKPNKITHNSVTLTWTKPEKNCHFVSYYKIYTYMDSIHDKHPKFDRTEYDTAEITIQDLKQNTQYIFIAAALCDEIESRESPSCTIRTKKACGKPGKPVSINNVTYRSIQLEWDKPTDQCNLVKHYNVKCFSKHNLICENKATDNTTTFKSLSPEVQYTFQVIAHCDDDVDIVGEVSDPIKTDKAICSAPYDPTVTNVTEYSAVAQWSAPVKYPELAKGYIICYWKKENPQNLLQMNTDCINEATITELEAETCYLMKVCAQQEKSTSGTNETSSCAWSGEVSFTTKPDACSPPGRPEHVEVTYNRVILTWSEPERHKELIQKYIVSCHGQLQDGASALKGSHVQFTADKTPKIAWFDLQPDTTYTFRVAGVCRHKHSAYSEPSQPIATRKEVCSQPGKPTASSITCNSITLQWARPTECAHLIHHYQIHQLQVDDDNKVEMNTLGRQEKKEIENLKPSTKYFFEVRAVCTGTNDTCTLGELSERSEEICTRKQKLVEELDLKSKLSIIEATNDELLCCLLKPEMNKVNELTDHKVSKYAYGTQPPISSVKEKVLLLVGASGVGKSTMINGIVNFIFGIEYRDEYRLKLIHDETNLSQAHSQTRWITSYTFYWQEGFPFPYTLTVIDTPGFGDTGGLEKDKELMQHIKQFFELKIDNGGMDVVHGIGFLVQSSSLRLTPTQQYIYNSILSIFGKDVANNIFIMTTFNDGGTRPQILNSIEEAGIPTDQKLFNFNNASLFQLPEKSIAGDTFWLMGASSFQEFFKVLSSTEAVSLQLSKEVLQERDTLQAIISGMMPQITVGLSKLEELTMIKHEIAKHRDDITANKDFEMDTIELKTRQIKLSGHGKSIFCSACHTVCHCPCYATRKKFCKVLDSKDKRCKVCPGQCLRNQHHRSKYRTEHYETVKKITKTDLEERYKQALKSEQDMVKMNKKVTEEVDDAFEKVITNIGKAKQCLKKLQKIALKKDHIITDTEYINLLIQSEKTEAKEGYEQRIEHLQRIQHDVEAFSIAQSVVGSAESDLSTDSTQFFSEFKKWKELKDCDKEDNVSSTDTYTESGDATESMKVPCETMLTHESN